MLRKVTHKPHIFAVHYLPLSSVRNSEKGKCEEDVCSGPQIPFVESEIL